MNEMMKKDATHCITCGVPNTPEINESLWDVYYRISDGRCNYEPLVYSGEEFEDSWDEMGETNYAMLAMERNMHERGLCVGCGRPNLAGVTEDMILSEEDLKEMQDMWAIEAQERRMGC